MNQNRLSTILAAQFDDDHSTTSLPRITLTGGFCPITQLNLEKGQFARESGILLLTHVFAYCNMYPEPRP
jgi:hypothetical protein